MPPFRERFPDIVSPVPEHFDPLGEGILNRNNNWFQIFEPQDTRVVIGRNQDPNREIHVDAAAASGVPIHRRVTGGGTVVLAPGTVVVAIRLRQEQVGVDCYFAGINKALVAALQQCGVPDAACFGHGDLAIEEDGQIKKVLGASLRQSQGAVYYLGVFMVTDQLAAMEQLLPMPSKQPDYRVDRGHAAFCTHLGKRGVTVAALCASLSQAIPTYLSAQALA